LHEKAKETKKKRVDITSPTRLNTEKSQPKVVKVAYREDVVPVKGQIEMKKNQVLSEVPSTGKVQQLEWVGTHVAITSWGGQARENVRSQISKKGRKKGRQRTSERGGKHLGQ